MFDVVVLVGKIVYGFIRGEREGREGRVFVGGEFEVICLVFYGF